MDSFPQFRDLPNELQTYILSTEPETFNKTPFLARKFASYTNVKPYLCKNNPTKTEFTKFLTETHPSRFAVLEVDEYSMVRCYLFNLVFVDDNGAGYWEVLRVNTYYDKYEVAHILEWAYLEKDYSPIVDYLSATHNDTSFNTQEIIALLYDDPNTKLIFDMLTYYRIISRRSVCYNDRKLVIDLLIRDFQEINSKYANNTKKSPLSYFNWYVILLPYAWVFNLGHLIYQKDINLYTDKDRNLLPDQVNNPDIQKLISVTETLNKKLPQLFGILDVFI